MLKKNLTGTGLSLVLFSLMVVVPVAAQSVPPQGGIPPGAASTETGLGGQNVISASRRVTHITASVAEERSERVAKQHVVSTCGMLQ